MFVGALLAVPFFGVEDNFAMEGEIIGRLVSEGLEEGVAQGIGRAAQEGFAFGAEEFAQKGLSEGVEGALNSSIKEGLQALEGDIAKFKAGTISIEELKQSAATVFGEQKGNFLKNASNALEKQGSFTQFDKALLEGKLPEGSFAKFGELKPRALAEQGNVLKVEIVKGTPDAQISESLVKEDAVDVAQNEVTAAKNAGGSSEEIAAKEGDLKTAKNDLAADQKVRANERETKVTKAKSDLDAAQKEFDEATSIKGKKEAGDKLTKANEKLNKTKIEYEESLKEKVADEKLTYKQEHDIAKEEYKNAKTAKDTADTELKQAKQELKDANNIQPKDQAKIDEAQAKVKEKTADYEQSGRNVEEAQKNLIEKENQVLEKSDIFKNKWEKTKIFGTKGKRGAWEMVKGIPASLYNKALFMVDQMWISILFGAPNMLIEGYNSAMAKKKLLETKESFQRWGYTWLKIPGFWINKEDPANSLNIYVGVPNDGFPITDTFLQTANYYVVKSDYTPWGSSSIFDNISDMVHLNTGFVFVSDGQAADLNAPTMPFIDEKKPENGLIYQLDALAGKASAGVKTQGIEYYVDDYEAGYQGNFKVANLFKTVGVPSITNFPPLLMPTVKALQDGLSFGIDKTGKALYLVQGFRGFNKSEQNNGKNIMAALRGDSTIESAPEAARDENYVIQGVYIYQTKDTPIVDLVKKQIAADDAEKQLLLDAITDYVVMLDSSNNIVPLMTPQPMVLPAGSKDSAFVHYALNPQIDKMKSLVDGSSSAYDAHGGIENNVALPADLSAPKAVADQIQAMQTFFNTKIKYGPFKYNGTILTIDKTLADANIFAYKAAGFLEGGFDDYFVALEAMKDEKTGKTVLVAASLPSNGIVYFVSLVTSRFYDKNLQPYAPPVAPNLRDYYIKDNNVATGKPDDATLPQAKAALYTLFVQGEYNPSPKPANFVGSLPVKPYWALDSSMFNLQGISPISKALTDLKQTTLLAAIKTAHENWITVLDVSDPGALSKKMGPFDFTTGAIENVRLRALNASALKLGYYIYTSGRYPDEFLVVSKNETGTDGVGEEFGDQQYLISLSNGNVYDAQANGNARTPIKNIDSLMKTLALNNAGVDSRIAHEQTTLNTLKRTTQADTKIKAADKQAKIKTIDAQIASIPTQKAALYAMVNTIEQSQVGYNRSMMNNLYSDDLTFGGRQLYLSKESYLAGQYIYADVTGLGDPLDANGKEIKAVTDQIKDYYVTYEEGPINVDTGKPDPENIIANQLNKNTTRIISLISGGEFDRGGAFVRSYQTITIADKTTSDLMDFVKKIFDIIKARMDKEGRPQTIILLGKIQPLLDVQYAAVKKELDAIAEAKKNALDQYPSESNLASNLFARKDPSDFSSKDVVPYVEQSPALLPRYLKQVTKGSKYYFVAPPASDPESDSGKKYEASRAFIDYDIDAKDHIGPNAKGMMYDRSGKPLQLLTGWMLNSMRAYAGLLIDASGKQSLGIGVEHPSLPLTVVRNGKTENVMIDTGIKIPADKGATFTAYYNTQIDNYFVQITTKLSNYFIDLTAGYGYNLDGTPRWYEAPLFTDDKGEVLLVGTDSFGLKKVAFKKQGATKYLIYNQMVSFGDLASYQTTDELGNPITKNYIATSGSVKFPEYGNAQGSYFTMLSDSFGDQGAAPVSTAGGEPTLQELRIGYAYLDQTGNQLTAPFYVVWDQVQVDNPGYDTSKDEGFQNPKYLVKTKLVGKFIQSPTMKFSLLNYVQTRNSAGSLAGTYKPEDFYNFPRGACDPTDSACIKTPKVVGILFTVESITGKQVIKELFYENQRCALTLKSKDAYSSSYQDATGKIKPITVKLESSQQKDSPLSAHWLSITDGAKILDFAHESMVWDTSPMRSDMPETTNLDYRKRRTWQLNVSNFITNAALSANFPGIHTNALATSLNAGVQGVNFESLVGCKVSDSIKAEINFGLKAISVDMAGNLYLPHVPSAKKESPVVKRYVYTFGKNVLEKNLSFYDPGLDGWSVDLNNGILYEPATPRFGSYPIGVALHPDALAELLGSLRLYVDRDLQGNPKGLGIANCRDELKPAPTTKSALKR